MAETPTSLSALLTDSRRIINAHSRHFLALTVLFLLPLTFSLSIHRLIITTTTSKSPSHVTLSLFSLSPDLHNEPPQFSTSSIAVTFAYALVTTVFSLLATGSITDSIVNGFYDRPVKLYSAIRSAFVSLFPLLVTYVVAQIFIFGIIFMVVIFAALMSLGFHFINVQIRYGSPYFIGLCIIASLAMLVILAVLQVNWILVNAIVVVESTWGLRPFRRSASLIKGNKRVVLSLMVFFLLPAVVIMLLWSNSYPSFGDASLTGWPASIVPFLVIVTTSSFMAVLMLYSIATTTILLIHCKAANGEIDAKEFAHAHAHAHDYVSLPFDDGKVVSAC